MSRQRHDIGAKKRAVRVPKKRESNEEKERRAQARVHWANWCRMRGHPRWCRCVYR